MKIKKTSTGNIAVAIKTPHGERTISTGTKNQKLAGKLLSAAKVKELEMAGKVGKLQRNVIQQIVVGKKVSIEKAMDQWAEWMHNTGMSPRTIDGQMAYIQAWAKFARVLDQPPATIDEQHISEWINETESGAKVNSRQARLAAIRSFFNFCSAKGYTIGDPSRLVRIKMNLFTHEQKEAKERPPFTAAQYKRIITYLKTELEEALRYPKTAERAERLRFWLIATQIGRHAGLRLSDVCTLQWDSFAKPGRMIVWTDKRDARVELPMTTELAEAVALIPMEDDTYCFPKQKEQISSKHTRVALSQYFSRICQELDMTGLSFHSLRHTFCTECEAKGISVPHISKLVGHRSASTTEGYIHEAKE